MTVFLFAFLHVLSVRSGLASLYFALLALGAWFVFVKKRYLLGLAGIAAVMALPVFAYFTVPSFKAKLNYARWDYRQFQQGSGADYPDAERFTSILIGLDIGREHPWFGIGAGDLDRAVKEKYASKAYGNYQLRMPHNQFVTIFAGTGLVGLVLFLLAIFYPLFYHKNYRNPLFLALYAVVFSSYFVENTIENNFGVSLSLFFLLVGLRYFAEGETNPVSAPKR